MTNATRVVMMETQLCLAFVVSLALDIVSCFLEATRLSVLEEILGPVSKGHSPMCPLRIVSTYTTSSAATSTRRRTTSRTATSISATKTTCDGTICFVLIHRCHHVVQYLGCRKSLLLERKRRLIGVYMKPIHTGDAQHFVMVAVSIVCEQMCRIQLQELLSLRSIERVTEVLFTVEHCQYGLDVVHNVRSEIEYRNFFYSVQHRTDVQLVQPIGFTSIVAKNSFTEHSRISRCARHLLSLK